MDFNENHNAQCFQNFPTSHNQVERFELEHYALPHKPYQPGCGSGHKALYTLVPTFFSILFLMTSSGRNIPGWLAAVDSDAVGVVAGLDVVGGAFGP
mgnify:CR=1 FL=1